MKKINLLALALVIGTFSLFAKNVETTTSNKEVLRSQIVQILSTPNFNLEEEITINVTFMINSEGKIVVQKVDTRNPEILEYIRENLCGKKIEKYGEPFTSYVLPINFK
jgi:hypothetical protein